jgi:hypothetical protein
MTNFRFRQILDIALKVIFCRWPLARAGTRGILKYERQNEKGEIDFVNI